MLGGLSLMGDPLTIQWHPTLKDAYHMIRLRSWGTPARAIRTIINLVILPGGLFGVALAMSDRGSAGEAIVAAVIFGLGWGVLFGLSFSAWLARHLVKTQRVQGDPQIIIVGEESVERVLKDSRTTYPWSAISRIEETDLAFLLFGSSGPVTSIEKSGISSTAELTELRSLLRAKKPGKYRNAGTT